MPFSAARATKSASPLRTVAITGPDANSTASEMSESACSSSWWTMTIVRFGSSREISSAALPAGTGERHDLVAQTVERDAQALERALVLVGDQHAQIRLHRGRRHRLWPARSHGRIVPGPALIPAAAFNAPQRPGAPIPTDWQVEGRDVHRESIRAAQGRTRSIFRLVRPDVARRRGSPPAGAGSPGGRSR